MYTNDEKITEAHRVFDVEMEALEKTKNAIDETFLSIVDEISSCQGKIVITGMGKPGHIAKKMAATFSSLGIPSFCLHPGEAMHGDLGMVDAKDVVIAISYSGESDEIVRILPNLKMLGAKIIAITGNGSSSLARYADITQVFPPFKEACFLGLAPTSSTTAALVYGDALAVVVSEINGFSESEFGKRHPAGSLGKKLILTVDDLMASGDNLPIVHEEATLMEAIAEISNKRLGAVLVLDKSEELIGIITDGDLRRLLKSHKDIYSETVENVMSRTPKTIQTASLAYDALAKIKKDQINCLPVVDGKKPIGVITWHQIIDAGIVM